MKKIIFVNFVFLVLLIFLIEITLRIVFSYNVQGISKDLINKNISYRFNTPNLDYAKAFGVKIYTDQNGFRIKKNQKFKTNKEDILIIGGSVTFGPAIKVKDTFVGKLNSTNDYNVKNASVFGTTFENNIKIIKNLKSKQNIKKILISFPLDDILSNNVDLSIAKVKTEEDFFNILKKNKTINYINSLIRTKSAAYVFIKGIISNPQENNYAHDIMLYENKQLLNQLEMNLVELSSIIEKKKILFFSIPYAAQIKNSNCSNRDKSEKILKKIFDKYKYEIIFLQDNMCKNKNPIKFYLKNDPVHLTKKGHEFVFENLQQSLN